MILMQLEGSAYSRGNDLLQQVHVCKYPLVLWWRDAEIPFEERVQSIQESIQAVEKMKFNPGFNFLVIERIF